jgi:hypothetical protein
MKTNRAAGDDRQTRGRDKKVRAAIDTTARKGLEDEITLVGDKFCAISKYWRDELLGQQTQTNNPW